MCSLEPRHLNPIGGLFALVSTNRLYWVNWKKNNGFPQIRFQQVSNVSLKIHHFTLRIAAVCKKKGSVENEDGEESNLPVADFRVENWNRVGRVPFVTWYGMKCNKVMLCYVYSGM